MFSILKTERNQVEKIFSLLAAQPARCLDSKLPYAGLHIKSLLRNHLTVLFYQKWTLNSMMLGSKGILTPDANGLRQLAYDFGKE